MKNVARILKELFTPSDQWRNWYGWCQNQCSHAFFGVLLAFVFPGAPVEMAVLVGLAKEIADLTRAPIDRRAVIDSTYDTAFWVFGAWIASTQGDPVAVIIMSFALVCGMIPRLRGAQK